MSTNVPKPEYGEPWPSKEPGRAIKIERASRCANFLAGVTDASLALQPTIFHMLDWMEQAAMNETAQSSTHDVNEPFAAGYACAVDTLRGLLAPPGHYDDPVTKTSAKGPETVSEALGHTLSKPRHPADKPGGKK